MKAHATALTFLIIMATSSSSLWAQDKAPQGLIPQPNQTDSALTAETRHVFQSVSENILKAARQMPEASYGFKPTKGVRTFGELIAHIANVQATLCGNINGHQPAKAGAQGSKDNTIKDLEGSVGECEMAFAELSAQNAAKMVQTPAGQLTHLAALIYVISHASEEYGQLGMYLRLNHMMPPTSDEPKSVS
jgi:uncharacterized damage-inducible protein DinB